MCKRERTDGPVAGEHQPGRDGAVHSSKVAHDEPAQGSAISEADCRPCMPCSHRSSSMQACTAKMSSFRQALLQARAQAHWYWGLPGEKSISVLMMV